MTDNANSEEPHYVYYKPIMSDEHFLYASELAEILLDQYGWGTKNEKPAFRIVSECLKEYEKHMLGNQQQLLYYPTKHGLRRVYPYGLRAIKMLVDYIEDPAISKNGKVPIDLNDGKTYWLYKYKR